MRKTIIIRTKREILTKENEQIRVSGGYRGQLVIPDGIKLDGRVPCEKIYELCR